MKSAAADHRFHLLRYFSLTSLVGILVASFLLVLLYRAIAITTLTDIGETVNVTLARTALISVKPQLVDYLRGGGGAAENAPIVPGDALVTAIRSLVRASGIAKVKIYNGSGTVVYSTKASQIGNNQSDNPGVVAALAGRTASRFIYRDQLNPFDREHSDANMIQSYLPVREDPRGDVLGVFEIYTDVSPLAEYTEQAQLLIFPVVAGIFLVLYLLLLALVRRAEVLIRRQDSIIRERNDTLEVLSAKLLSAQEQERKQLAHLLHEEIAQILSAVKLKLTNACRCRKDDADSARDLDSLDAHLKDAIQEVRSLAMRIRPSTLDDMGLLTTLGWLLRELRELHPGLTLHNDFQAAEEDIPKPLKIIIFRIVQDTLNGLANETEADHIGIALTKRRDLVELAIEENAMDYRSGRSGDGRRADHEIFELMSERTVLSGGEYERDTATGGVARHVSNWRI